MIFGVSYKPQLSIAFKIVSLLTIIAAIEIEEPTFVRFGT